MNSFKKPDYPVHRRDCKIFPRQYTPETCRVSGCDIAVIHSRYYTFVTHEQNSLCIPPEHMDDDAFNVWGEDAKPWLESQHAA